MKRLRSKRAAHTADAGEILPECDFSHASPNKYASRYAAGSAVVVLEPDVAAAFPSPGQANEALRAVAGIIQKHRSRRSPSRRSLWAPYLSEQSVGFRAPQAILRVRTTRPYEKAARKIPVPIPVGSRGEGMFKS
jgi:hypothetical protein